MNSEKIKKALRIAVNVGCGFEGDAEDAVSLLGLIEANEARIAELEAAQRWIPVSERLPEIGVRVLFYNNFIKNIHKGWYSGDEWVSEIGVFYNGDKLKRITHWMPLPKLPEVQE